MLDDVSPTVFGMNVGKVLFLVKYFVGCNSVAPCCNHVSAMHPMNVGQQCWVMLATHNLLSNIVIKQMLANNVGMFSHISNIAI